MILDEKALVSLIEKTVRKVLAEDRPPEEIMTKAEVAKLLQCTERSVGNYMTRDGLPFEHRGRIVIFRRSQVIEWHRVHGRKPLSHSA